MSKKLIPYEKFFQILEENFCKTCEFYDKTKGHLWEDAKCCTIKRADGCLIFYLTGLDEGWEN